MRDPWFQSFMTLPTVICGVRLLPYSLAHDYLLAHLNNPYADENTEANEADLFEAIRICSRTWEENRRFYMGQDTSLGLIQKWVLKWHRKMDFKIADESFRTYLSDYRLVAEHKTPPSDPAGQDFYVSAPHHWHLVVALRQHLHMTESEAWNYAFNSAKCTFDVWSESNGDETLESVTDMEINRLCREAIQLYKSGDIEGMRDKYRIVTSLCDHRQEQRKK